MPDEATGNTHNAVEEKQEGGRSIEPDEVFKAQAIKDLPRIRSSNYVSVYTNHTQAGAGFWDLRLHFGEMTAYPGQESASIEDHVAVTMTWEHAKAVHALLGRMIAAYEKRHGDTSIRKQPSAIEMTV